MPAALLGALGVLVLPAIAQAQESLDPTTTPTEFTGGWVYAMAILMTVLGAVIAILVVVSYMRFAPRFQRGDSHTVRAERIVEGREPPRRQVEVREAEPVLVAAPVVQAPAPAAAPPAAAPPAATPQKPAAAAPATAPPAATPAPTMPESKPAEPKPPGEVTPAVPTGAAQPAPDAAPKPESERSIAPETQQQTGGTPAQAATPTEEAPAQAPAPSHSGGAEQDQETYDRVLAEQLSKGVDRRVAEGRAKSAAVVAARKKAGG
jgi:outer membrane biosynthesis protein TonB